MTEVNNEEKINKLPVSFTRQISLRVLSIQKDIKIDDIKIDKLRYNDDDDED